MPSGPAARRTALGIALGLVTFAGATLALEERERAQIERLVTAGRCEEALDAIARLAAAGPLDAKLHKVAGRCETTLARYPEAVASFERARALDPTLPNLDLQLGIAQFHAEDLAGAEASFARAREAGATRPELDFYEALVDLQSGRDPVSAAKTIERAGAERPASLQPAADYYAALAWERAADPKRAEEGLSKVVRSNPNTPWASAAQSRLDRFSRAAPSQSKPWVRVSGGMEYDSNVAFLGRGLATPDEIDSKSDFRGVWSLDAGAPLFEIGGATVGVRGNYFGSAHVDANDWDLESPGIGFWVDRPIGEKMLFRLEAGYQHAWLGYEPYVGSWNVVPQIFVDSGRFGTTRFYAGAAFHDFLSNDDDEPDGVGVGQVCPGGEERCGPAGIDEREVRDRDGVGVLAGIDHTVRFHDGRTEIHGGPIFERYAAEGDEWDSYGFGAEAGVRRALPWDLTVGVDALYLHRPYSNASSYPDPRDVPFGRQYALEDDDRTDDLFSVDVWLERPITDRLTASIRYGYLDNSSNTAVFDYDRHLVGAYLTYTWQKDRKR